uniref:Reticulon n=1 Tax=Oryzias sinensis TaxID=183150 RepID=A0A8C7ZFE2_9TELE
MSPCFLSRVSLSDLQSTPGSSSSLCVLPSFHLCRMLIDKDVSIPPETFRKHVDASLTYINRGLKQMSRLFLVEDLVDSLKLAVVMWLLTYVGAVFNGITLLILADILLFAVPPVYEKNKTQIDQYIDVVRTQVNATVAK